MDLSGQMILLQLTSNPSLSTDWESQLKPLLKQALGTRFSGPALLQRLDAMDEPPFTLQRLAELLLYPDQYAYSHEKYYRAVEKCLVVSSFGSSPVIDLMDCSSAL